MKDYIYSMMDERKELVKKWEKLLGFFNKNRRNLDDTERYLLHITNAYDGQIAG